MALHAFEFLFLLIALVLGLAITEVLGGLVRALENRPRIRLGWLSPLLGLAVLLDLTSYWALAAMFREVVQPTLLTFFGALAFSSVYYLAAYRVFPSEFAEGMDLDARFFEVRRFVLGMIIAARLLDLVALASVPEFAPALRDPFTIGTFVLVLGLTAGAMMVRSRRSAAALLTSLILLYIVGSALPLFAR